MKRILLVLAAVLVCGLASANDGVFYTAGNQLVPTTDTDIALRREVLTIKILKDNRAEIDVVYELENTGDAKDVIVGFEAPAPSGAYGDAWNIGSGIHPCISGFSVEMNGAALTYQNALTQAHALSEGRGLRRVDRNVWSEHTEFEFLESPLYPDSFLNFSYTYYFDAHFDAGLNRIHHHYIFQTSTRVDLDFGIDYLLTPALRWANGQIDDFTLIIDASNVIRHFHVPDAPFGGAPTYAIKGKGKQRHRTYERYEEGICGTTEFSVRNAVVSCRLRNFRPRAELTIRSADDFELYTGLNADGSAPFGAYYDVDNDRRTMFTAPIPPSLVRRGVTEERVVRNLPYAARGHVYKDAALREFFGSLWWYMPEK